MTSTLHLRLRGALALCCAALCLTACSSGHRDGSDPDGSDGSSPEPPPWADTVVRTLPAGELTVVSSSRPLKVEDGIPGSFPVVGYSADRVFSVTEPDDVLHVVDRRTGKVAWTATVPKVHDLGAFGVCRPPELASDRVLAVFVGHYCELLYTYDVATGRRLERTVMSKNFQDEIGEVHLTRTAGAIWWATEGGRVGYVDEDGSVVEVLTNADLGVADDDTVLGGLDTVPGEDRLIVNVFHDDHGGWNEWIGVDVDTSDEPASAEVRWRFSDRATPADLRTLALPDYARGTSITMPEDGPGGLVLAGAKGGRIAIGQPDAETGHVDHPAHLPLEPLPSVADLGLGGQPEYLVTDDTLYTSIQSRDAEHNRLAAYDLATGRRRWSQQLPAPGDLEYYVQSVQVAEDGALYVETTDEYENADLVRIDPDTGRPAETWPLPNELGKAYSLQVIGDRVYATMDDATLDRRPGTVVLGVQPEGTANRAVDPASGPVLATPHVSLHLADHVRWKRLAPFHQGPVRSASALGSSALSPYLPVNVTEIAGGPISGDLAAEAKDSARTSGRAVARRPDRTIDGVHMVVVAASRLKDGTKNVELFYAAEHGGAYVEIAFEVPDERPPSMLLIESMLKSITWK